MLKIFTLKYKVACIVCGGQFEFASKSVYLFVEFHSLYLLNFVALDSVSIGLAFNPERQTEELMLPKLELVCVLPRQVPYNCARKSLFCYRSIIALMIVVVKEKARLMVLVRQMGSRSPRYTSYGVALRLGF